MFYNVSVYYKKPYGRRHRFRRHISSYDSTANIDVDGLDSSEMEPSETRFHHFFQQPVNMPTVTQYHYNTQHERFDVYSPSLPKHEFYPRRIIPEFSNSPFHSYLPPHDIDCTDYRHDICRRKHDISDKIDKMNPSFECCKCLPDETTTELAPTTTSTEFPPIDIRRSL